jgi:hypothetical protein
MVPEWPFCLFQADAARDNVHDFAGLILLTSVVIPRMENSITGRLHPTLIARAILGAGRSDALCFLAEAKQ